MVSEHVIMKIYRPFAAIMDTILNNCCTITEEVAYDE